MQPKPGDLMRVTVKMKRGTWVESFRVRNVQETKDGRDWYVGFEPCGLPDSVQCAWGYTRVPKGPPTTPYGVQRAEVVR